jgi:hypothetical protein
MPQKLGATYLSHTDEEYESAIIECLGDIKLIAAKLEVSETAVDAKIRRNAHLKQLTQDIRISGLWSLTYSGWLDALQKKEKWAVQKGIEYIGHYYGLFKSDQITTIKKTETIDKNKISDEKLNKILDVIGDDGEVALNEFNTGDDETGMVDA